MAGVATGVGLGVSGLGSFYGAYSQSNANNQNFNASQQHQALMQGYVNQMIQPGINPYAQAMLNFTGQGLPVGISSFVPTNQAPYNPAAPPQTPGQSPPPNPSDPNSDSSGHRGTDADMILMMMHPEIAAARANAATMPQNTNFPGNTWQGAPLDQQVNELLRLYNFSNPTAVNTAFNGNISTMSPQMQAVMHSPEFQQAVLGGNMDFSSFSPELTNQLTAWAGQAFTPTDGRGPVVIGDQSRANVPAPGGPYQGTQTAPRFLINGQLVDANGQIVNNNDPTFSQPYYGPSAVPPAGVGQSSPQGTIPGAGGGGNGYTPQGIPSSGMYRYQSPGAFTYNPTFLNNAPMVSGLPQVNPGQVNAPQAGISSLFQAPQIGNVPQVGVNQASTGTQGLNTGQDALMQMLRSNLQPSQDPSLSLNLQQLGSGNSQYDATGLFGSLHEAGQRQLDKQVAQLQGSAGSLGQRFGTAMNAQEGRLRGDFTAQQNLQDQQIGMQSFENAQNRRQPALNTMASIQDAMNQFGLQGRAQNIGAAQGLIGAGQAGQQLDLQAQLANQGAGMQASLANQSSGLQAGLTGQALLAQLAQFNAGQGLQANTTNAQLGMQGQQLNQSTALQAALANQNLLGQYATNNANIANQAGQFNSQMRQNANQFDTSQGNTYNNLILGMLNQAGSLQQAQSGYNASLLGILNGVGVPQAQVSPWGGAIGDVGSTFALLPFLNQMFAGSKPTGATGNPNGAYSPGGYPYQ